MRAQGRAVAKAPLPPAASGTFVPPTLIEIGRIADVNREVFGPVLHVLTYKRADLDRLIAEINASGYGLTFGLHTRIDETIARVVERVEAGNIYVNRNIIGATVGVQPFGGSGLCGTGPKAGGPLYLARLLSETPPHALEGLEGAPEPALRAYADWLRARARGRSRALRRHGVPLAARRARRASRPGRRAQRLRPAPSRPDRRLRRDRDRPATATRRDPRHRQRRRRPRHARRRRAAGSAGGIEARVTGFDDPLAAPALAGALIEGEGDTVAEAARRLAARPGPILRAAALRTRSCGPARTTRWACWSRSAPSPPTSRRRGATRASCR